MKNAEIMIGEPLDKIFDFILIRLPLESLPAKVIKHFIRTYRRSTSHKFLGIRINFTIMPSNLSPFFIITNLVLSPINVLLFHYERIMRINYSCLSHKLFQQTLLNHIAGRIDSEDLTYTKKIRRYFIHDSSLVRFCRFVAPFNKIFPPDTSYTLLIYLIFRYSFLVIGVVLFIVFTIVAANLPPLPSSFTPAFLYPIFFITTGIFFIYGCDMIGYGLSESLRQLLSDFHRHTKALEKASKITEEVERLQSGEFFKRVNLNIELVDVSQFQLCTNYLVLKKMLEKSLTLLESEDTTNTYIGERLAIQFRLSKLNLKLKLFEEAINCLSSCLDLRLYEHGNGTTLRAIIHFEIAEIYYEQNKYQDALREYMFTKDVFANAYTEMHERTNVKVADCRKRLSTQPSFLTSIISLFWSTPESNEEKGSSQQRLIQSEPL